MVRAHLHRAGSLSDVGVNAVVLLMVVLRNPRVETRFKEAAVTSQSLLPECVQPTCQENVSVAVSDFPSMVLKAGRFCEIKKREQSYFLPTRLIMCLLAMTALLEHMGKT